MELQLGLALAPPIQNPDKCLDLKICGFEPNEQVGSTPWTMSYDGASAKNEYYVKNKRSFIEAFGNVVEVEEGHTPKTTLPLVSWSDQPHEEKEDNCGRRKMCKRLIIERNQGVIVGWPPINSLRKKLLYQHHHHHQNQHGRIENNRTDESRPHSRSNSMYVKVKMEGVAIGRKIDLNLYHSYQTLKENLISMFSKNPRSELDVSANYTLAYQDREGEWLIAGDVPWRAFINSVHRLEILNNAGSVPSRTLIDEVAKRMRGPVIRVRSLVIPGNPGERIEVYADKLEATGHGANAK
ncbi:AUX/IAA domain [Dillenia turbinata]|uniref:Auxin-responsive protein n=1 Tax=Dillenia turbinata TaxID=194707 RepID=A0AAN8UEL6_9MAGN